MLQNVPYKNSTMGLIAVNVNNAYKFFVCRNS